MEMSTASCRPPCHDNSANSAEMVQPMLAIEDAETEIRAKRINVTRLINVCLDRVRRLKTGLHDAEPSNQFLSATVHTLDFVNYGAETEIQVLEATLVEITEEKQALEATVDELSRKKWRCRNYEKGSRKRSSGAQR